jgi:hypothetical protein
MNEIVKKVSVRLFSAIVFDKNIIFYFLCNTEQLLLQIDFETFKPNSAINHTVFELITFEY